MPIWGMVLSALAEIRIGRVRVALSIFCVAVGVAAITLVTVVSGVSQQAAREVFEREVGRPVTLTAMPTPDNGPPRLADDTVQKVHDDLERYHITVSTLREASGVSYRYNGRTVVTNDQPIITQAVDPSLSTIRRLSIVSGRWLENEDQARLEPQLVVTSGFANALGLSKANAVGAEVEVGGAQLWVRSRIVGIISASQRDGPGMQVYLPYAAAARWGLGQDMTRFAMRVPAADVKRVTARLKSDSTRVWGLAKPMQVAQESGDFTPISGTLSKLMLAAAITVLVLGALPVLALGLAAVRQRRSELGVHRCFGATGADLFLTVLLESLLVSLGGGLLGIGLAYLAGGPLTRFLSRHGPLAGAALGTGFPWRAALLGLGVSICVGLLTGLLPALRAMQRSVIQAIRA